MIALRMGSANVGHASATRDNRASGRRAENAELPAADALILCQAAFQHLNHAPDNLVDLVPAVVEFKVGDRARRCPNGISIQDKAGQNCFKRTR